MSDLLIQVIDLHKSFTIGQREIRVLKGIQLEINRGELLGIVGASGVGKSTLLHMLGALDRPTSGQVIVDGEDISQLNDNQLAHFRNQKIGFVFQFHHLLPEFTALENTMMPALIKGSRRKDPALPGRPRGVGASERSARAPISNWRNIAGQAKEILKAVGLEERLHHRPGELSGGEQQRVAVARALILGPQVILADEPTGNLDTQTSEEVFSLLKRLQEEKGMTLLMVTHNESLARQADRIVKMVDGRIEKG